MWAFATLAFASSVLTLVAYQLEHLPYIRIGQRRKGKLPGFPAILPLLCVGGLQRLLVR